MPLHPQLDELINRVLPVVQDFHGKGMFSPHAASVDKSGALSGSALTSDGTTQLSVSQAIAHFETKFRQQVESDGLAATGIFYHSPGIDTSTEAVSLPPASTTDECKAVVALLEHAAGDSFYLIVPYAGVPPNLEYAIGKLIEKPARVFLTRRANFSAKPWWKLW